MRQTFDQNVNAEANFREIARAELFAKSIKADAFAECDLFLVCNICGESVERLLVERRLLRRRTRSGGRVGAIGLRHRLRAVGPLLKSQIETVVFRRRRRLIEALKIGRFFLSLLTRKVRKSLQVFALRANGANKRNKPNVFGLLFLAFYLRLSREAQMTSNIANDKL